MKRWKMALLAVAASGALALSGCTGTAGSGSADSKTINYWGFPGGVTSATAKEVIAKFEKDHPGYKVNGLVVDVNDVDAKLPSTLGKPSGPDLVYTGTEPNHLGRYVQAGQVLSLAPFWEKDGWNNLNPSAQQRVTYDGKPYAVGNELETVGLIYNKKLFEKLGLQVPTSLDELEGVMNTIKQKAPDVTPMDLACGGPCYSGLHMMHALGYASMPTKEVLATTPQGKGNYTDPGWKTALGLFQSWNQKGYFTKDASGVPDPNHQASFCNGTTAMMASGPWEFAGFQKCEQANPQNFEMGFAGFPVAAGLPFQAYVGPGKAWFLSAALSKDSAKEQAVLDLVHDMTAASTFKSWIETDQLIPAMKFDASQYTLTQPQQDMLASISKAGKNGGAVDIGFNNSAEDTNIWVAGLQGILSGSSTPQDVLAKLQSQLLTDRQNWRAAAK